ncbi:MAG: hypothetical protein WB586_14725 [Chthoniobacterales bacterium]
MTTTIASKFVLVRHPQVMPQLVQTLDSPAGLAAFIYDKFNDWTYSGGDDEKGLRRDEMLDDIIFYRLTNTAASSKRPYWGSTSNAPAMGWPRNNQPPYRRSQISPAG